MAKTITINESATYRGAYASVEIKSEPIRHTFDDRELGAGPAAAIRDAIVAGVRAIGERASPATSARRRRQGIASDRLYNVTGRLADTLAAIADGATWAIKTAQDRLSLGGSRWDAASLSRALQRLYELVPALRAPLEQPGVKRAIEASLGKLIDVGRR